MSDQQRLLVIGVLVSSTLYLASCITLGYLTHRPDAWQFGIACAGVCYLAYMAQLAGLPKLVNNLLFLLTIALGLWAGLALLF